MPAPLEARSWSRNYNGSWSCNRTSLENYRLTPQNPDFGPKRHFGSQTLMQTTLWGRFWGYISKTENVLFAPGDPLYNSRFHTGILTKS